MLERAYARTEAYSAGASAQAAQHVHAQHAHAVARPTPTCALLAAQLVPTRQVQHARCRCLVERGAVHRLAVATPAGGRSRGTRAGKRTLQLIDCAARNRGARGPGGAAAQRPAPSRLFVLAARGLHHSSAPSPVQGSPAHVSIDGQAVVVGCRQAVGNGSAESSHQVPCTLRFARLLLRARAACAHSLPACHPKLPAGSPHSPSAAPSPVQYSGSAATRPGSGGSGLEPRASRMTSQIASLARTLSSCTRRGRADSQRGSGAPLGSTWAHQCSRDSS